MVLVSSSYQGRVQWLPAHQKHKVASINHCVKTCTLCCNLMFFFLGRSPRGNTKAPLGHTNGMEQDRLRQLWLDATLSPVQVHNCTLFGCNAVAQCA